MSKKEEMSPEESKAQNEDSQVEDKATEVDYEAELEKLQNQLQEKDELLRQKNGAITAERERRKMAEGVLEKAVKTEDGEPEEDAITKAANQAVQQAMSQFEQRRVGEDIDQAIASVSENEAERKLIREYYKNRLNHTGYSKEQIQRDIEDAQLLANRQKFQANAQKRAKKAVAQKHALEQTAGTPSGKSSGDTGLSISEAEYKYLKRYGLSDKEIKEKFSK